MDRGFESGSPKNSPASEGIMAKHVVVSEVDSNRQQIGAWLVIAVPDDFNLSGDEPFPEESLRTPIASFADRKNADAERERLNQLS
jgi:hypothetical protein